MVSNPPFDRLVQYANDNEQAVVRGATINKELYTKYGVKRGLRDENGKRCSGGADEYIRNSSP